jgi:multidrug efflux pump subunit AcrB
MNTGLGYSGKVAKAFLTTQITPLLALIGLLLGVFAVVVTPREEEPQINVTFANIFVPFPGAAAEEVEQLVSIPAEQVLSEIQGIKHVFSVSQPGMSVLTVQFEVGEDRTDAIVRLYNKIFSNQDWLPADLGVGQPIIKPKGIDDVPFLSLTLWTEDPNRAGHELLQVAHAVEIELKRVPGTRDIYTLGGPERVVHVWLDPQRMAGYDIALDDLRRSLAASNTSRDAGALVDGNRAIPVQAGTFLTTREQVQSLVVGVRDGKAVYLSDVAAVHQGPDHPESFVWFGAPAGKSEDAQEYTQAYTQEPAQPTSVKQPAVTLAIAKKPGTNAVALAKSVIQRFESLRGTLIPQGVEVTVTRNYGATADDKAKTLIAKLFFATSVVVLLVLLTLGLKEAIIVGAAVVVTLALTLFASWAWGFTLNRVSLFALIFSIGILVDDAIVVVENIHRHLQLGAKNLLEAIPRAVDEVGGPTILATFTVIAALLPMAFVTGLMGPYMSPIPINASMGMLISLIVAFVITPWLTNKALGGAHAEGGHRGFALAERLTGFLSAERLEGLFQRIMGPFLGDESKGARRLLLLALVVMIGLSLSLVAFQLVVLKMLPFDDKSELQILVDMPEGTAVEQTARVLDEVADYVATVPEVADYQIYAGLAAPINFNGLVRQYYLRRGPHLGDVQVNLVDKAHRERKSHEVALALRPALQTIARKLHANIKVVEVPPGPPVMAPLVAEIYGPDYAGQIDAAQKVRQSFEATQHIVDVDDSVESQAERIIVHLDQAKAALLGVTQDTVAKALAALLRGEDVGYLHGPSAKYPVPIRIEYPVAEKAHVESLLSLRVRSASGTLVPLSEILQVEKTTLEKTIYHKDLLPVVFVTGDMAGGADSPLYGLFDIYGKVRAAAGNTQDVSDQFFVNQPEDAYAYSLKWDGEWQVTYETFRDMGLAYGVGMLLIYLLVVAQFRSYLVPLVIMAPIPLTVIGVLPGHALLDAQFTATSMIGMIALAGIIVRNSILLVDFIIEEVRSGRPFEAAVITAGAVRTKPIVLTALAAMLGALFILDDPIFRGLAVSLIFGILVSTLLTLVVVPVLYYATMRNRQHLNTG